MTAENCPHSLYEQRHTYRWSKHILANNLYEHAVKILTISTSTGSRQSKFSRKCPLYGGKGYYKQIHCRVSTDSKATFELV